jgi:hypothetical protein
VEGFDDLDMDSPGIQLRAPTLPLRAGRPFLQIASIPRAVSAMSCSVGTVRLCLLFVSEIRD